MADSNCYAGGAWPFEYTVTSAPSGVVVGQHYGDTDYGVISWPAPTVGSHSISIRVRTQDYGRTGGSADSTGEYTLTFSLSVVDKTDTSKFLFMDAAGGNNGNSGSYSSPWQTLAAFVAASTSGKQLFLRAGTYATNILAGTLDFASRAKVVIGYPGEAATISCDGTSGRYLAFLTTNGLTRGTRGHEVM